MAGIVVLIVRIVSLKTLIYLPSLHNLIGSQHSLYTCVGAKETITFSIHCSILAGIIPLMRQHVQTAFQFVQIHSAFYHPVLHVLCAHHMHVRYNIQ